jgi:phenylpropionate dioxygenase-like ring-hydroxylating dioxygenase large terminal subunit
LGQVVSLASGQSALQCAYHGWTFASGGPCMQVPAQPQWQPPASHCATVYECAEHLGLVWARLASGSHGLAEPWALPIDVANWVTAISGPHTVATSAPRLVENFLDMAHFGFVHPGSLGDPSHTELPAYAVNEHEKGISVPECKAWQPNPFDADADEANRGRWVNYRYEVLGPYTVILDKLGDANGGSAQQRLVIAMFNCPVSNDQTRTWFWIAALGLGQTPAQMAAFQDTIFAEDSAVVESQSPKALPLNGLELHGPLDRVSAAYRRFLQRLRIECGTTARPS